MDGKTLGVDENPHANDDAKTAIQEIIWRLMKDFDGQDADPSEVAVALSQALADAGIPEQPAPWVNATADEIAGSREVVMDVSDQVEPETVDGGGPQPTARERAAE